MINIIVPLFLYLTANSCYGQGDQDFQYVKNTYYNFKEKGSVIEFRSAQFRDKDSFKVGVRPIDCVGGCDFQDLSMPISNGKVKWKDFISLPFQVSTNEIPKAQNSYWIIEPGDSMVIDVNRHDIQFSGRGSEKFELQLKLKLLDDRLKKNVFNPVTYGPASHKDYFNFNNYLNSLLDSTKIIVNSYKSQLSSFAFKYIMDVELNNILDMRTDKFYSFLSYAYSSGLTLQSICDIYDSTYLIKTGEDNLPSRDGYFFGSWGPIRLQVGRRFSFDRKDQYYSSELTRTLLYFELGLKSYKGIAREKFLSNFLIREMIKDLGFIPEVESALASYYSESGYSEYKSYVKDYEEKARNLQTGKKSPDFSFADNQGNIINKNYFYGKIVLMDFWFTGFPGCVQLAPILRRMQKIFENNSHVVFVSISTDEDKGEWLKSITGGKYTTVDALNLYTEGLGINHPSIKAFNVSSFPSLFLLDADGKIIQNPLPDPRLDNGKQLIALISKQLTLLKDGPYVFINDRTKTTYSINGSSVTALKLPPKKSTVVVQTDVYGKEFTVKLQKTLLKQATEFEKPVKLFILSDIEGNFEAFSKLLQANKVIDESYNWKFGKGHLVFAGDMFDRGKQVTECLWLMYSLEEKAKTAGGYVHFVLGNHELMNLQGDHRYVQQKYKDNAKVMNKTLKDLYNEESELGKWLRTKNIIEKIGDLLFIHAGISKELNKLPVSVSDINQVARPHYADTAKSYKEQKLNTILSNKVGPFWYRDYYLDQEIKTYASGDTVYKASISQVNETLNKFNVSRIITGHTIVADTISVHYGGKVINTDTKHAEGKSEALLIEGDHYYRVNQEGKRVLLFVDDKKKTSPSPQ